MKLLWWLFLIILPLQAWAIEFNLNSLAVGYGYNKTKIKVGNYRSSSNFNQILLKTTISPKEFPNYYLAIEGSLNYNETSFKYQQILLNLGQKFNFNQQWMGTFEIKYGLGFMQDKGSLYKTESFQGQIIGLGMGLNYRFNPRSPWAAGFNLAWIHQMHSKSFWGNNSSSSYTLDSLSPQFLIIYIF